MHKKLSPVRLLVLPFVFLVTSTAQAEDVKASSGPHLPYVDRAGHSWDSECKKPKEWKLDEETPLFSTCVGGKSIGTLSAGTTVKPITSLDVVTRVQPIKVLKSFDSFKAGDTAYLLSMGADASYRIWYKGKVFTDRHDEDQNNRFEDVNANYALEMWVQISFLSQKQRKKAWILSKKDSCDLRKAD